MAQLVQINISQGGVPKNPIHEAHISVDGVQGDKQKNLKYHGGPDKAVCIYSLDRILTLQREGHSIWPGATGENLTISELKWEDLRPGIKLSIGYEVVLEVTQYAAPCNQINNWFNDRQSKRISEKLHPGWARLYCKVLKEGTVRPGDLVRVLYH